MNINLYPTSTYTVELYNIIGYGQFDRILTMDSLPGFIYITQGWVSSGRNRFLPDIQKKLEERVFFPTFFHFFQKKPGRKWKKPQSVSLVP